MKNTIKLYLPANPDMIKKHLIDLGNTKMHIAHNIYKYYYLINHLFVQSVIGQKSIINLDSQLLRTIYGIHYKIIINNLKLMKYMSLASNYSRDTNKANGYKLMDGLKFSKYEFEIKCKFLEKVSNLKLEKIDTTTDVKSRIFNSMCKLNFENINLDLINQFERIEIENIINNPFQIEGVNGKRIFNNFTNLSKNIRKQVTLNDERLVFVDIVNSQLVFLSSVIMSHLKDNKIEIDNASKHFSNLCSHGKIYEFASTELNLTRDKAKKQFMLLLFGEKMDLKIRDLFKIKFPQILAVIDFLKIGDFKRLSHLMQIQESDLIFNAVKHLNNKIDILTIHDSLYSNESNMNKIKNALIKAFDNFGLVATINVNDEYKILSKNILPESVFFQ